MRTGRSPRTRTIAILVALLVIVLGLLRWEGGTPSAGSSIRRVDTVDSRRSTAPAPVAERRAAPSISPTAGGVPSPTGGAGTAPPVFDLATLTRQAVPEPSVDDDRFRTNERFTADDLAHPERYFDAAEQLPELRRDEERHDALEFFLAYRARLERDLGVAGRDADKRAAILAVMGRYDAAIARLRSSLATQAP